MRPTFGAIISALAALTLGWPVLAQGDAGPSFVCQPKLPPLAQMICADPDLSRTDLQFSQAYWALYQQGNETARRALKQEDLSFLDAVQQNCGIPRSGTVVPRSPGTRDCVKAAYLQQRMLWTSRTVSFAREEATRPLEAHVALQRRLQQLGFLPENIVANGVYAPLTRRAIAVWQRSLGRAATGFLGSDDARVLAQTPLADDHLAGAGPAVVGPGGSPPTASDKDITVSAPVAGFTASAQKKLGPSFICQNGLPPLARMICADPDLSRTDLQFFQAYWALYQQLDETAQHTLQQERDFITAQQQNCGIPRSSTAEPPTPAAHHCVKEAYLRERELWISRMVPAAREEVTRPPEANVALERRLQQLGFEQKNVVADGIYVPATRSVIATWQLSLGRSPTGFLGDDDARILAQTPVEQDDWVNATPEPAVIGPGGSPRVAIDKDITVSATSAGFDGDSLNTTIALKWKADGLTPAPPLLRTPIPAAPGRETVSDSSLKQFGKRWLNDQRLDMVVVAVPNTVRIKGAGFFVVAPGQEMPFGINVEPDRLRLVFPLYLPESKPAGEVSLTPLRAGPFHLSILHLTVTASGRISKRETAFDKSQELVDRAPIIMVQDRVTPEAPVASYLSQDRRYELRVFDGRFEVLDAESGGLLLDISGTNPRFSPTARFLSYETPQNLVIVDILDRKAIDNDSKEDRVALAFLRGDGYAILEDIGWGGFNLFSPLVDRPAQQQPGQDDPTDFRSSNACHACTTMPDELRVDLANGIVAVVHDPKLEPGDTASLVDYFSILAPSLDLIADPRPTPTLSTRLDRHESMGVTYTIDTAAREQELSGPQDPFSDFPSQNPFSETVKWMQQSSVPMVALPALRRVAAVELQGEPVFRDPNRQPGAPKAPDRSRLYEFLDSIGLAFPAPIPVAETADETNNVPSQIMITERLRSIDGGAPLLSDSYKEKLRQLGAITPDLYQVLTTIPPENEGSFTDSHGGLHKSYEQWVVEKITSWRWQPAATNAVVTSEVANNGDFGNASEFQAWVQRVCVFASGGGVSTGSSQGHYCFKVSGYMEPKILGFAGREDEAAKRVRGFASPEDMRFASPYLVAMPEPMTIAIAAPATDNIAVVDLEHLDAEPKLLKAATTRDAEELRLSADRKYLFQLDGDGKFYIYSMATRRRILSGVYIDDEVVVYTDDGFYDGTDEGGRYAYRFFPGLGQHYAFSQFASRFHQPALIRAVAAGKTDVVRPSAEIVAPPSVDLNLVRGATDGSFTARVQVTSSVELKTLRLFVDGAPLYPIALIGPTALLDTPVDIPQGAHWVTAVAYNAVGYSSVPKSALVKAGPAARTKGKLFYVGVAIDQYPNYPGKNLKSAKRDMNLLADTISADYTREYRAAEVKTLADAEADAKTIPAALVDVISRAEPVDTLIVSFAGHGLKDGDRFYLMTGDARPTDIAGTALPWDRVADVLSHSKARVIVLLDACHSGAASEGTVVPNDGYASALMRAGKAGMIVLAASKGRQSSQEGDTPMGGHGYFTYAVAEALGADRAAADRNGDGVIEIDELYSYVKATVAKLSQGTQTPWLSHDEIIGQAPLM